MKRIQQIFNAHLLIAVAALAGGYALAGAWLGALIFLVLGGLWFAVQLRASSGARAVGVASLMLFLFLPGCAVGMWLGVPGWLALIAAVAALGAWDLDHFLQRLSSAARVELGSGLGRAHLLRLASVEGVGLLAGLAALMVRARLPFWWEVLLVILAVAGISRLISLVRRQVEE